MFRKVVLNNGVRVVAERMPATRSVTLGIWVNVGSRDEQPGEEGVSHFIEHMAFKGTRRRSAAQISREIDSLGGEMNAFTTRETTAFYVKVVDEHLRPACALLADLFYGSRFEPKEVEKEKLVVLEEIRMIQDDPEDLLHDLHIKHQLQRHPLGKPIVGEPATIKRFKRDFLLGYVARHYVPHQTVLAVAGAFEWKSLVPVLEASFGSVERKANGRRVQRWPAAVGSGLLVQRRSLEQVHLCFGLKGVSIDHKDRYAAHVLNAALGGGVSSRLFQRIREERGLAYSIYSYLSGYSDTGMLAIYAGTSPRQAPPRGGAGLPGASTSPENGTGPERAGASQESVERWADVESGEHAQPHAQARQGRALPRASFHPARIACRHRPRLRGASRPPRPGPP